MGRGFFDVARADSVKVGKAMVNILDEVLNTLEAIFARRLTLEEMTTDGLKNRLEPLFSEVGNFVQDDFENTSTFSSIIQNTRDALIACRKSCTRHRQTVTMLEFQLDHIPPVSV